MTWKLFAATPITTAFLRKPPHSLLILLMAHDPMATRQGTVDYEFVDKVPNDLTCSICMKVLCQPHLVNCCEKLFCKKCLEKWSKTNKSCPHCRSTDFVKVLLKQKNRRIGELKVYCPNKKHGCNSILKINSYDNHLSTTNAKGCQYVLVSCPYNCAHPFTIRRCNINEHKESQYPRRPVNCVHCKLEGEHEDITGDHLKTCPSYPLDCPQQCGATVLRKDLEAHKDICPEEQVACPFSELGCKVIVQRKDLEKHVESSAVQHMTVLAQSHLSLKADYTALKAEHAALKKSHEDIKINLNAAATQLKDIYKPKPLHQRCPIAVNVAKMYPLLVDTSELTLGHPLLLSLSETNKESGYHYFIVSKFKFKLKWQRQKKSHDTPPPGFAVQQPNVWGNMIQFTRLSTNQELKLYLVVDETYPIIPKSWSCDITVHHNKIAACRGKLPDISSDHATDHILLGTVIRQHNSSQDLEIRFDDHDNTRCQCRYW